MKYLETQSKGKAEQHERPDIATKTVLSTIFIFVEFQRKSDNQSMLFNIQPCM